MMITEHRAWEAAAAELGRLHAEVGRLHIELARLRGLLDERDRALLECLPIIEGDAHMMADISRHSPLDAASQYVHDNTEYASERLALEIPELLNRK